MMSQRVSAGRPPEVSGLALAAAVDRVEKFMSAMLTYIGFNVTRLSSTTKYYVSLVASRTEYGPIVQRRGPRGHEFFRRCDCRAAFRQTYWTSRLPPKRKPALRPAGQGSDLESTSPPLR